VTWTTPKKSASPMKCNTTLDPTSTETKNQKIATTRASTKVAKPKKKGIEENYYFPISTNYKQFMMATKQTNKGKECGDELSSKNLENEETADFDELEATFEDMDHDEDEKTSEDEESRTMEERDQTRTNVAESSLQVLLNANKNTLKYKNSRSSSKVNEKEGK
jgi:hypothetical protein